ncbi:MAG: CHASE3 domain-containing protein [Verrucomicrobiota bacterium]|jgi:CHASE3 domain sensor protein
MDITQRLGRNLSWLGFLLPLIAILALGWLSYRSNAAFVDAFQWVGHSYKVLNQTERIRTRVTDIENGQRDYFVTGKKEYLQFYTNSVAQIWPEIEKLKTLAADNPIQLSNAIKIQVLVSNQILYAEENIAKREAGSKSAQNFILMGQEEHGKNFLGQVRGTLASMHREENRLLSIRQQRVEAQAKFNRMLSYVVVIAVIISLAAIRLILRRIEKLQNFVTVCAWSGQVKYEGKWIRVDEYLHRRFGASISHGISQEAMMKMKQELQAENPSGLP